MELVVAQSSHIAHSGSLADAIQACHHALIAHHERLCAYEARQEMQTTGRRRPACTHIGARLARTLTAARGVARREPALKSRARWRASPHARGRAQPPHALRRRLTPPGELQDSDAATSERKTKTRTLLASNTGNALATHGRGALAALAVAGQRSRLRSLVPCRGRSLGVDACGPCGVRQTRTPPHPPGVAVG